MPELLLELFSEEIPARMQARGAEDLSRLVAQALAPLAPAGVRTFHGPRRLTLVAEVRAATEAAATEERGPRSGAPEAALAGFLRKHGATKQELREEGGYWVLARATAAEPAASLIARELPPLIRRFPWPKSMRWGRSNLLWVRPLRRIVCLLDGAVVPFDLRDGADDGHGLASADLTEGHRFHAPGAFAVTGFSDYAAKLRERRVMLDPAERRTAIAGGLARLVAERDLSLVPDDGLLDEVTGLVEWPVPLLGRIDDAAMDLPPEVRKVSMRVNQRYFTVARPDGTPAPFFAFVANVDADDGGTAIIAGNERVLRARLADARHFWDADRKVTLESRVPALDRITFHAKLGTQGDRVKRLVRLARIIAPMVGADPDLAARAALLAKADLTTGMVGEFPELQGVMGGHYAAHDGEAPEVVAAVRDHYAPRGAEDAVPTAPVTVALGVVDRIDALAGLFAANERPTGSGDPFALRRAAIGLTRLIRSAQRPLPLMPLLNEAWTMGRGDAIEFGAWAKLEAVIANPPGGFHPSTILAEERNRLSVSFPAPVVIADQVLDFLADRLRVQLRTEGARHDVLAAVFAAGADDDIVRLLARTDAVAKLLESDDGKNLVAAHKRAANILRIEDRKDGPHQPAFDLGLLTHPAERALADALTTVQSQVHTHLDAENFTAAMAALATLRPPVDDFFANVTVNDPDPALRRNRLGLLAVLRATMDTVADFSRLDG
jgi:glycyl-tRNA synthetase beta chain